MCVKCLHPVSSGKIVDPRRSQRESKKVGKKRKKKKIVIIIIHHPPILSIHWQRGKGKEKVERETKLQAQNRCTKGYAVWVRNTQATVNNCARGTAVAMERSRTEMSLFIAMG